MSAPSRLRINRRISIPRGELRFSFVRSSGPGGQNVNKVNTKAVLRWKVSASNSLPEAVRERFLAKHRRRVNDRGELVVTSQRYRDQARNVDDCLEKLKALVLAVATAPRPRVETRPPKSAGESRLREKRATAEKKQRRKPPGDE